jgi:hypothetical protein
MTRCQRYQRAYKAAGLGSIVVGDENYGEDHLVSVQPWSLATLVSVLYWSNRLHVYMRPISRSKYARFDIRG